MKNFIERVLLFASIGDRRPPVLDAVSGCFKQGVDLDNLSSRAVKSGEAGNLADLMSHAGIEATGVLKTAAERELRHTLAMRRNVRDIISLLNDEELQFIPLKGADPRIDRLRGAFNPMTDIDILVREEDCDLTARVLTGNGWRFLGKTSGSHLTFYRPEPECMLELHWDLVNRNNPLHSLVFTPDLDEVWKRSILADGLRLLSPADTMAYLSAHAVKEYYHKPKWLADIAWVMRGTALNEEILTVIAEWGAVQSLLLAVAAIEHAYDGTGLSDEWVEFGSPGFIGNVAAASIINGRSKRFLRPLFWIAAAPSFKMSIPMITAGLSELFKKTE